MKYLIKFFVPKVSVGVDTMTENVVNRSRFSPQSIAVNVVVTEHKSIGIHHRKNVPSQTVDNFSDFRIN